MMRSVGNFSTSLSIFCRFTWCCDWLCWSKIWFTALDCCRWAASGALSFVVRDNTDVPKSDFHSNFHSKRFFQYSKSFHSQFHYQRHRKSLNSIVHLLCGRLAVESDWTVDSSLAACLCIKWIFQFQLRFYVKKCSVCRAQGVGRKNEFWNVVEILK